MGIRDYWDFFKSEVSDAIGSKAVDLSKEGAAKREELLHEKAGQTIAMHGISDDCDLNCGTTHSRVMIALGSVLTEHDIAAKVAALKDHEF